MGLGKDYKHEFSHFNCSYSDLRTSGLQTKEDDGPHRRLSPFCCVSLQIGYNSPLQQQGVVGN